MDTGRSWWTCTQLTITNGGGPIIPDYSGPNVSGIIPALLGPARVERVARWFPSPIAHAEQAVLLVLDGLGWDQFEAHRDLMPTLSSMTGGPIHTVAPTTTATALSSIATGLTPAEHGLIGYRMVLGGEIINVLRWTVGDRRVRRSHPAHATCNRSTRSSASGAGRQPGRTAELGVLRGPPPWRHAHAAGARRRRIAVEAGRLVAAGERFVYCYYGGIDKIAHERGFGAYYEAELRTADRLVGDLIEAVPPGTAADRHGGSRPGPRRRSHHPSLRRVLARCVDAVR